MVFSVKKIKLVSMGFIVTIAMVLSLFFLLNYRYPLPNIDSIKPFSQLVIDHHGRPLRAFADKNGVWRYPTSLEQVSKHYLTALINYEDRYFWQHNGVNPLSLLRAIGQWLVYGKPVSGGSTLTMQVVRMFEPYEKSISGKLWQIFRAYQLEFYFDKEEILTLYLNYAPYGGVIEGIEAACYTYLGKSAKDLTHAQAALMAVLPQAPSRYRPDRHPLRAQQARNKVLDRLASINIWSWQQVAEAKQETVSAHLYRRPIIAPLLARRLAKQYPKQTLIQSTLNKDLQQQIEQQLKRFTDTLSDTASGAVIIMENESLNVLAYAGSADFFNHQRYGHIDMLQAVRSPGSTLKPFIYSEALDQGLIHSQSLLQDIPIDYNSYQPENFNKQFIGPVSATAALQQSLNIPAVTLLQHIGAKTMAVKLQNAGLDLFFSNGAEPSLAMALGGVGIKLEQLVGLYRAFNHQGLAGKPRLTAHSPKTQKYLMSAQAAWITSEMLSAIPLGPLKPARLISQKKQWLAFKTGTSYGHRDAWMIAMTPEHTVGIWIGKPDGTPSLGEYGRKTISPLMKSILGAIPTDQTRRQTPQAVRQQVICWPQGLAKDLTVSENCLQRKEAWTINNITPKTLTEHQEPLTITQWIDPGSDARVLPDCHQGARIKKTTAVWPIKLEPWLKTTWRRQQRIRPYSHGCKNQVNLEDRLIITGIENNTRIKMPGLAQEQWQINLAVLGQIGPIRWTVNNQHQVGYQTLDNQPGLQLKNLTPGQFHVIAIDQENQKGELRFELIQ